MRYFRLDVVLTALKLRLFARRLAHVARFPSPLQQEAACSGHHSNGCPPPKNDARRRRSRLSFEELESRDVPSTLIYEDVFDFSQAATVTVTVTEDAPGYEGKYLWNYHVHNDAFQHGPGNYLGMFAVDLVHQDFQNVLGVGDIGNSMGWWGVETLDPAELAWQAGEFDPQIEIGESGDFWFTTPPTAVLLSDGFVSDTGFAFQAGGPVAAPAPALLVTTELDNLTIDQWTSLREAINYANDPLNSLGGQWRITFASNVAGKTITLGDLKQLPTLAKDMFIDGTGKNITVERDATKGDFRLFRVTSASKIFGLKLKSGGGNSITEGGAIASYGFLHLKDCVISGNRAKQGGGVHASERGLIIEGCDISQNTATLFGGGGLYLDSALIRVTISNSSISYNTSIGQGGGIFIVGGQGLPQVNTFVELNGATIAFNSAGSMGGGIYVYHIGGEDPPSPQLVLTGGTSVVYNWLTGTNTKGGGIYLGAGSITFDGALISSNLADLGDGLYAVTDTGWFIGEGGVEWENNGVAVGDP